MRLPSANQIVLELRHLLRRFPGALLCTVLAVVGGVGMVGNNAHGAIVLRLWIVGTLGLPVTVALALWNERSHRKALHFAGLVVLTLLLGFFFVAWSHWSRPGGWHRYLQLLLAGHLLASFLPFVRGGERNGFWQYNRLLLQRFLLATVFAGVLYVGLSIALLALDNLLGMYIDGETYQTLFFLIFFFFHPLWFLGGVPSDLDALEHNHEYPRPLRIFSQYILLPLVSVYLLILSAYLVKVLVTWVWPSGWIGYLVSSVCTAGVLSILLLQPLRERRANRWVAVYCRGFYIAILPALIMLLLAVGKRVAQYGITENRYFILVLALWMTALAFAFSFSRRASPRIIPLSLFVVALVSSVGPWGAYQVSKSSQLGRLRAILERNELLAAGRLQPAVAPVNFEDSKELSALMSYLLYSHGDEPLRSWCGESWAQIDTLKVHPLMKWEANNLAEGILETVEVEYVHGWDRPGGSGSYFFRASIQGDGVAITGYDYAIHLGASLPENIMLGNGHYTLREDREAGTLVFESREDLQYLLEKESETDTPVSESAHERLLTVRLEDVIDELRQHEREHVGPTPPLVLHYAGDQVEMEGTEFLLVIRNMSTTKASAAESTVLRDLRGELYLRLPESR